ncbi:glycosyltransferase family 4 protein [Candidatus Woesearchaeota archaeon]|nr:glycosyltransferase family 4 protein [Candidatus Woesearchaeota archaeon]
MKKTKKKRTKKPRLLIATDNFLPRWDGVARFLSEIIPGLRRHYTITVIGPDNGPDKKKGYKLIKIPVRKKRYGDFRPARTKYWKVRKAVKRADIVFAQTIGPIGAPAVIAAKKQKKPLACYIHIMEDRLVPMAIGPTPLRKLLYPLMRWYTQKLFNKADLLLTPSEWVSEQLMWNSIKTEKRVVRLGVDTERFKPGTADDLRNDLGITPQDVVIGQHGRLAREKDLKTLLRGFIRLRARHKNVKLLIIGEGLPEIQRMLARQEGVILPGKQDDVVPYLRAMDIFALSSLTETTSLAALEAMSCGLPLVSTPVGFVKDYIKEGENGYFFPIRDPYTLAKKIEPLLEDATLRKTIGKAARHTVTQDFTWDRTTKGIVDAITTMRKEGR